MAYSKTTWANSPATSSPISAANLNKMETGIATATGFGSALYVAASNSSQLSKDRADYICDGTADQTEINTALTDARTAGHGNVILSEGSFNCSGQVQMWGSDNVNIEYDASLIGQGPAFTTLVATTNITGGLLNLAKVIRARVEDLRLDTSSALTTDALTSTATQTATAGWRSFWMSTIRRVQVQGSFTPTHTGWGLNLEAPFRSVLENIEVGGTGKGMRMYGSNANQNPGDCVVSRCFMDVFGDGYRLESTVAGCNFNQIVFHMIEAFCNSSGATGIFLGGTDQVNQMQFSGVNLEQFDKLIHVDNGQGNRFDCNYLECRGVNAMTAFHFGANAHSNHIRHVGMLYSANTLTLIDSDLTNTSLPNLVEHVTLLADTGSTVTNSITTAGACIRKWTVNDGEPGTATAVLVTPA